MISIYPEETETLIVPYKWEEVFMRLSKAVSSPVLDRGIPKSLKGWVENDRFELTMKVRRQQLFLPIIRGRIESTSKGSLLFITYSLFPATKMLMTFWSVVLPLISLGIAIEYKGFEIPAMFAGAVIIIHIVARSNFKLHLKSTQVILHDVLEI